MTKKARAPRAERDDALSVVYKEIARLKSRKQKPWWADIDLSAPEWSAQEAWMDH